MNMFIELNFLPVKYAYEELLTIKYNFNVMAYY